MDPVSAVGIASTVIQFAGSSHRFLKSVHELYKSPFKSHSGYRSKYIEQSIASRGLLRLAGAIEVKLDENQGLSSEVFVSLHGECKPTNDVPQRMLSDFMARDSTKIALAADSWRVASRQAAMKGITEKPAKRLSQIHQKMKYY